MDNFDSFYSSDAPSFGTAPSGELRDFIRDTGLTGNALDLGCGDGRNTLYLAASGFTVTAVDSSRVGLEKLNRLAADRGLAERIRTVVADARKFEYAPNSYDLVASVTLFDHLPSEDIPPLFKKVTASLKVGGILFVKAHTVDDPGHNGSSAPRSELSGMIRHYFDHNELLQMVTGPYYVVRYEEIQEEDTSHGPRHFHAFAKLLARKRPSQNTPHPLNQR